MYKSSATKYYFTQFLILNTIALNLSAIACFLSLHHAASPYCPILSFLNNLFTYWASFCLMMSYLDRYLRMKNYLRIFGEKRFLIGINSLFFTLSFLLSSPLVISALFNSLFDPSNSQNKLTSFYINDCRIYQINQLVLFDLVELVFNLAMPFLVLVFLNSLISLKLIKSKRVLSKHVSRHNSSYFNNTSNGNSSVRRQCHEKQTKKMNKQMRFVLTMVSINIFSVLLKLPLLLTRFFKHLAYLFMTSENNLPNSVGFTTNNSTRFVSSFDNYYRTNLEKYFLYESIALTFRTFYYVFPFFINFLLNPYFKKQIVKIFCFNV
jgi:hypothetical protein